MIFSTLATTIRSITIIQKRSHKEFFAAKIERMAAVTISHGQEHLITALGLLHDHGRNYRHAKTC